MHRQREPAAAALQSPAVQSSDCPTLKLDSLTTDFPLSNRPPEPRAPCCPLCSRGTRIVQQTPKLSRAPHSVAVSFEHVAVCGTLPWLTEKESESKRPTDRPTERERERERERE